MLSRSTTIYWKTYSGTVEQTHRAFWSEKNECFYFARRDLTKSWIGIYRKSDKMCVFEKTLRAKTKRCIMAQVYKYFLKVGVNFQRRLELNKVKEIK